MIKFSVLDKRKTDRVAVSTHRIQARAIARAVDI